MPKIDRFFDELLTAGGSDLHLGIGYPPLMRLRGELVEMRPEPVTTAEVESLLFEIVTPQQKETITKTLDLDFAYAYGDKARFRPKAGDGDDPQTGHIPTRTGCRLPLLRLR